ncbi:MAG: polysaccharide biosynthesis/export family protein [Deltaproteobacteria bacterium]|nr:polysaccharide biosynthesis/export family protein [Deltaproteobacteria bacterium]
MSPLFHFRSACCVALVALLALSSACASKPPPAPVPPETVAGERAPYVIGVTDQLSITVWRNQELSVLVPVRSDGMISVPLVDDVQAEGLTPEELKEVLTEALSEYISAPDVTVVVVEMNSNVVSIIGGGTARSGVLPLRRETRVLEAVAAMGGFTVWAKRNKVKILRPTPGGMLEYRFNYGAFLKGKAPDSNIVLKAGDTIVVPD